MSFRVKLSEIAEIVMGQSPTGDECNNVGDGMPLLNGPTEFTERFPAPVQFTIKGRKFSKSGDILFCVRGSTTGRMNYADQVYAIGRGIGAIRGINGYPTPYIRAVLELNLERLLAAATGSTFPNVGKDLLNDFEVEVSTPEDANKINKLIVAFEEKKFLNTQTNKTLESIAQAIFKSWFVDFEPVKAKMAVLAEGGTREQAELAAMGAISGKSETELAQLQQQNPEHYQQLTETAALFPSAMVESEFGEIPEGWEVKKIGDYLQTISKTFPLKTTEEAIFLNTGDIQEGVFLHKTKSKVANFPGQAKKSIQKNDILYSEIRPENKRFAYVYFDSTEYVVSTKLMVLRACGEIDSKFLYFFLTQQSVIDQLQIMAESRSGTFPQITFDVLSKIEFTTPRDHKITNRFAEKIISSCMEITNSNIQENTKLAELRDSLLPKLLSGEIDLSDIQSEVA